MMDGSDGDRVIQVQTPCQPVHNFEQQVKQHHRMIRTSVAETMTGLVSLDTPMTVLCILMCSVLPIVLLCICVVQCSVEKSTPAS